MIRSAVICLVLLAWLPVHADTNQPPAKALLLDDKAVYTLTAGLQQYANPPRFAGKFTSIGSGGTTALVNQWAAEFATLYPEIEMDIHGGGSLDALPPLLEGKVDLVPMSRPMSAEEAARFKQKFGYEPSQIVVAQDAIGVFVNKNNPLKGLTLTQLDAIYSREDKRGGGRPEFWSDLGVTGPLADKPISRVCLNRAYGSHLFFRDYVMQGSDYRFDVQFEVVPSSLVQAVGADDAGIGFASVMFATARTRFVPLQADDGRYLLPSYENTLNGRYPLVRPLRIVFNRKPDGTMNPAAREFLRFAVSRRGQRIIALAGSYPLTVEQQQAALRVIGDAP
jgi:phosphate transport system substrate-binding protein